MANIHKNPSLFKNHRTSQNTFPISVRYHLKKHCPQQCNRMGWNVLGVSGHVFWLHLRKGLSSFVSVIDSQPIQLVRGHDSGGLRYSWQEVCRCHRVGHAQWCQWHRKRGDMSPETPLLAKLYETIVWEVYAIGSVGVEKHNIYLN